MSKMVIFGCFFDFSGLVFRTGKKDLIIEVQYEWSIIELFDDTVSIGGFWKTACWFGYLSFESRYAVE